MKDRLRNAILNNRRDFFKFLILILFVIVCILVTIQLMPWIVSLKTAAGRTAFEAFIRQKGALGVLILFGVQLFQVVVAFVPGEPVQFAAGLLYGTFWGWIICIAGVILGTMIIFALVRLLGESFIRDLLGADFFRRFHFLNDSKRLQTVTFLLFLLPGVPKDVLTYFMPLTKIDQKAFLFITVVARTPALLTSTFAGASIRKGDWVTTLIIFLLAAVVGLLGLYFNRPIMERLDGFRRKQKEKKRDD